MKPGSFRSKRGGFSYVEVLVATTILALSLVPALDALQTGLLGSGVDQSLTQSQVRLRSKMEAVLAEPFKALQSAEVAAAGGPSTYSDAIGTPGRRLVLLSRYDGDDADADGDPMTGADVGLLRVRVEIEASPQFVETLVSW
jgi:type II secretory pathway pseudopilin PulG